MNCNQSTNMNLFEIHLYLPNSCFMPLMEIVLTSSVCTRKLYFVFGRSRVTVTLGFGVVTSRRRPRAAGDVNTRYATTSLLGGGGCHDNRTVVGVSACAVRPVAEEAAEAAWAAGGKDWGSRE